MSMHLNTKCGYAYVNFSNIIIYLPYGIPDYVGGNIIALNGFRTYVGFSVHTAKPYLSWKLQIRMAL
jgi:hypothetical protein